MNLLVFMNPNIIKQYQSIRRILDKKLRQRDDFLEKNNGGEDPYEEAKLDMVKSLPPVDQLKSGGRVENADGEPKTRKLMSRPRSSALGFGHAHAASAATGGPASAAATAASRPGSAPAAGPRHGTDTRPG